MYRFPMFVIKKKYEKSLQTHAHTKSINSDHDYTCRPILCLFDLVPERFTIRGKHKGNHAIRSLYGGVRYTCTCVNVPLYVSSPFPGLRMLVLFASSTASGRQKSRFVCRGIWKQNLEAQTVVN